LNIIVLHGDDYIKSKRRLDTFISEAKKRSWLIERVDAVPGLNLAELVTGVNLFNKDKLVVVENINRVSPKQISWISQNEKRLEVTLVLINEGFLNQRTIGLLPKKSKIEIFKLPRELYNFLYAFYPGNGKTAIRLFKMVIKAEPPEMVFALLSRHLRDIYRAINDRASLPYKESWRVDKIVSQASKFKGSQLKRVISSLAEADIKAKTSLVNLVDSLDQIILTQLE